MQELTEFNEGGTHEQNPLGGIPLKEDITVEQGETKKGDFIYSDRIAINDEEVKMFNLPGYIKNKTVAEATKIINNKFKDRNDKPSVSTKNEFLNRLATAQEYIKQKSEKINESMGLNSKQMFLGGNFNAIQASNIIGSASSLAGANPAIGIGLNLAGGLIQGFMNKKNAYKGLQSNSLNQNKIYSDQNQMYAGGILPKDNSYFNDPVEPDFTGLNSFDFSKMYKPTNTIPQVGFTSFQSDVNSIDENKNVPLISQINKGNLLKKDNSYFNNEITAPDLNGLQSKSVQDESVTSKVGKNFNLDNIKNFFDKNGGKILKYSPVAMNAYQLSQLKKPSKTVYNTLSNKYNPNYIDEARLQNIANNEMNNQINAISQIGGSEGAMRNSILAAGLNKSKVLSDSYINMNNINREINDKAQQFNLGVDQYNNQVLNKAIDEYRMDDANYRTQKSKFLGAIGSDLGAIGREEINKNQIAEAYGYSWDGKYLVDKKTGQKFEWNQIVKPTQAKYGGMIKPRLK